MPLRSKINTPKVLRNIGGKNDESPVVRVHEKRECNTAKLPRGIVVV